MSEKMRLNMRNVSIRMRMTNVLRTMLVSAALCILWPGMPANAADDIELDLTKGDIKISSDGYIQGDGKKQAGPDSKDGYIITTDGKETDHVITVTSGKKHDILLDRVKISTVSGGYNPLYIAPDAKVSLTLKGENVLHSGSYAAVAVPENASVEITAQRGGSLEAWTDAADSGSGIGGTSRDNDGNAVKNTGCGTIKINSGMISTTKIGGTGGGSLVSDKDGTAWIDAGSVSAGREGFTTGVLFEGNAGQVYGNYTLNKEGLSVPANKVLTIGNGQTLKIPSSYSLALNGNLMNNGTLRIGSEDCITGSGYIGGDGAFYILSGMTENMFSVPDKVLYGTGEDHTEYVKKYVEDSITADGTVVVKNRIFNRTKSDDWEMEISPSQVIEKGTYTVTFTNPEDGDDQVSKSFEVLDAGEMTKITLTTPPSKTAYTYGERFDKTGMAVTAVYSSGATKSVANNKIGIKEGGLTVGQTSVTLVYKENGKEAVCPVDIVVSPREIDVSKINWEEKTVTSYEYDGTEKTLQFKADLPEGLKVSVGGMISATEVGTYGVTVNFFLEEGYEGNYVIAGPASVAKEWNITPRQLEWNTGDLEVAGNTRDGDVYVYGELRVEGYMPADQDDEMLPKSFPAGLITGRSVKNPGNEQEIQLVWKDESMRFTLGDSASSGNYVLPEELPVVYGVINEVVKKPVPHGVAAVKGRMYRLDLESGVSRIPDGLRSVSDYDLPSEIEKGLIAAVMEKGIRQTYVYTYDPTLMRKQQDAAEWERADADEVSSEGLTITVPYPKGISKRSHNAVVAYVYPDDIEGIAAGTIIYPDVEETEDGLEFVIPASAPVAVGWKEAPEEKKSFWEMIFGKER